MKIVLSISSAGVAPSSRRTFADARIARPDVECCCKYCELYVSNETSGESNLSKDSLNTGPMGSGGGCGNDNTKVW